MAAPDAGSDKACRDAQLDRACETCSRNRHRSSPRASRASGPPCPTRPRGRPYHGAAYRRLRTSTPPLVGVTLDLSANLTGQAIDLFDRLVGTMLRKAEG